MKARGMMKVLKVMCLLVAGLFFTVQFASADKRDLVIDGSTTVGPVSKAFAEYFMAQNPGVNITVSESGSGNGIRSLINGECDIAQSSRFMRNTEFKAAVDAGIFPVVHVVGLDGLAPVVHPANPVSDLTLDQMRDIYSGKITNWKELGGPDLRIVKVSRDTNSGTYGVWMNVVMRGQDMSGDTEYVGSNGAIRQRVQTTQAAIGFVGLGFVDRTLKALRVNGVASNPENVSSGKFPIARPLYLITNGYPKLGSTLHRFMTVYLTQDGQKIVEGVGFVPVTRY